MIINIEEKEQTQYMTINGVQQTMVNKFVVLSCPNCKTVLNQISDSYINVVKLLSIEQNQGIKYCPQCATKIDYPIIIDLPKENIKVVEIIS